MRITSVAAQNFLSFASLDISGLDPRLTVLVGPNGSGKSNLVRLLSFVRDAAGWPSHATLVPEDFVRLRRLGTTKDFSVAVDLELTEDRERELVVNFLRAALLSADRPSSYKAGFPTEWEEWLQDAFHEAPSFLFAGTLRVALPDTLGAGLDVTFELDSAGVSLTWSASQGLGRPPLTPSRLSATEAFLRAKVGGAAPEDLSGLFSGFDPIALEVRPDRLKTTPDILQRLGDLSGEVLDLSGNRYYSSAWVFHHLFRQGLYLTDNIRVPPRVTLPAKHLTRPLQSLTLSDGSEIPLYLFRLKLGDAEQREKYREICRYFHHLTGWHLELSFRPRLPTEKATITVASGLSLQEQGGGPRQQEGREEYDLTPVVQNSCGDVPIGLAGAGAWEAAVLSVFLAMPGGVLVLDEPALNLHPVRQRRLLEMLRTRGQQVLLVTHSPYMVPVDEVADLGRIIRFVLEAETTQAHRAQHYPSAGRAEAKWLRWLSELTDVRSLLFARGVILVEGGTEQGALSTWFAKSSEAKERGSPEDHNISIFSVGGDQNFQIFISLLIAFAIPWAVVCDGRVYRDREENGQWKVSIFQQLLGAGVQVEETSIEGEIEFEDAKSKGAAHGVFTLTNDFPEELENYLKSRFPEEFAAAAREWPKSKVHAGRMLARRTDCPIEVADLYTRVLDRFDIQGGSARRGTG